MSEPIPESIPTSADPRSHRPTKKRALTPRAALASQVTALFAHPERPIHIPSSSSDPKSTSLAPPEIVANVQGSSAGAGSGEFHVYKASRRREYERLRLMDEEVQKEDEERGFRQRKEELERKDREKTEKNRAKRQKAAARKQKAKKKGGEGSEPEGTPVDKTKSKLPPRVEGSKQEGGEDNQEREQETERGEVKNADEVGLVIEDDD